MAAGLSDIGLQREHNEDSYCILPEFDLFLVADGMGGHRAGDVASRMATNAIATFFQTTAGDDATWPFHFDPTLSVEENRLVTGIKVANKQIFEASVRNRDVQGMGTTLVGALFSRSKSRLYVAHVGDSRCYRVREGAISQLTKDHSLINEWLHVMPDMTPQQREELPKNVITRALGMQDTVTVDLLPEEPRAGDVYLLCSDGLSGMIPDEEILDILGRSPSLEITCRRLVARANDNGGEDNITAVVMRIGHDDEAGARAHPSSASVEIAFDKTAPSAAPASATVAIADKWTEDTTPREGGTEPDTTPRDGTMRDPDPTPREGTTRERSSDAPAAPAGDAAPASDPE